MSWTFISSKYVQQRKRATADELATWRDFLIKLGVQESLQVQRINKEIDPKEKKVGCVISTYILRVHTLRV